VDKLIDRIIRDFCSNADGYTVGINKQVKRDYQKQAGLLHSLILFAGIDLNYQYTEEQIDKIQGAGEKLGYIFTS
jgi:hypothetical protein